MFSDADSEDHELTDCSKVAPLIKLCHRIVVPSSALRELEAQTNIYLEEATEGLLRLELIHSETARLNKVLNIRGSDGAYR